MTRPEPPQIGAECAFVPELFYEWRAKLPQHVAKVVRKSRDATSGGRNATVYDGRLFFQLTAPGVNTELYQFDLAVGEIQLAADLSPGGSGSRPLHFVVASGLLYFSAMPDEAGRERNVYAYDGDTNAVTLAARIDGPRASTGRAHRRAARIDGPRASTGRAFTSPTVRGLAAAVYPNPASSSATLVVSEAAPHATVSLYDLLGRRVALLHDGALAADAPLAIDTALLPSGLYLVTVRTAQGARTQMLTVVR